MSNDLPTLVAICGNPHSGKSTAAKILAERFGYEATDDGAPLREFACANLGLTREQVETQAGKEQVVHLNGRDWECRAVLGELGNALEHTFGPEIIPLMSWNRIRSRQGRFVFASVRRDQPVFWYRRGALIIEIVNPLAPPSPFEFDRFNTGGVATSVFNDGLARGLSETEAYEDLAHKLSEALGE